MSLFNWFLAAITMTIYSLLSEPGEAASFAVKLFEGLRVFIGVIIAGVVTCAIIFFTTESQCKKIWPVFFPGGGLTGTPGVFRLKLRRRMLVIFILASILPLILMAVLSYNKASQMLVMDPARVIQSLLYLTAFLLIVTLAVAMILSRTFSTGIIDPVRQMEDAMAKVEKGDLTATGRAGRKLQSDDRRSQGSLSVAPITGPGQRSAAKPATGKRPAVPRIGYCRQKHLLR
jgi:hypothetical protein